nr:hypothetical protein [Zobellia laminariae]
MLGLKVTRGLLIDCNPSDLFNMLVLNVILMRFDIIETEENSILMVFFLINLILLVQKSLRKGRSKECKYIFFFAAFVRKILNL